MRVKKTVIPTEQPCHVSAGTLPEGNSGGDHRRRPRREPRSRDHRPRGQWDGDHSLEPDAGHSEEACVHVAPTAQDLVLLSPSRVNKTLCSSCSFPLCPCGAALSLRLEVLAHAISSCQGEESKKPVSNRSWERLDRPSAFILVPVAG